VAITENHATEQLKRYKQTLRDIQYILKMYKRTHPEEAWETIKKLANDPKLRLKSIKINDDPR